MSRGHGGFVMSGNVIEIPQNKRLAPIWVQQLRVAAYCRVSTGHEEQQSSLKNQIEFYTEYIQQNIYWRFVAVYYPSAWAYVKTTVIIVITVIFTDKATGKPRNMRLPRCFLSFKLSYWCPCPSVSNCCSRSQATASAGCSIVSNRPAACSLQVSCGWQ